MSAVNRIITADKEGFLEHLRAQRDQWASSRDNPGLTQKVRAVRGEPVEE